MNARRREREALRRAEKEARLARFEEKCGKLREEGYEQTECTVTIKSASVWGFALAIPFAAAAIALCFIAGPRAAVEDRMYLDFFIAAVAGMVCIPVHEGLHGLVWGIVNGSFSGIRFGILREGLTPYCACETPMNRARYLAGCLAPFVVLGLGFAVAGALTGFFVLALPAAFNILSAGGDLLISLKILCAGGGVYLDHPFACGFYRFYKKKEGR